MGGVIMKLNSVLTSYKLRGKTIKVVKKENVISENVPLKKKTRKPKKLNKRKKRILQSYKDRHKTRFNPFVSGSVLCVSK